MTRHIEACGNCSYNCCCTCTVPNCYLCRHMRYGKRCSSTKHPTHLVCFGCRRAWKRSNGDAVHNEVHARLGEDACADIMDRQSCPGCNRPPKVVPSSIRVPKRHKAKAWRALELHCAACPTAPQNGWFRALE